MDIRRRVRQLLASKHPTPPEAAEAPPAVVAVPQATEDEPERLGATDPEPEVLAVLYDEINAALDRQLSQVEHLNGRAQQTLGFAAVILTVIAAVTPTDLGVVTKVMFALSIPIFLLAVWFASQAWESRAWDVDPDVESLWNRHRSRKIEWFRHQVIQNRLQSIRNNDGRIEVKRIQVERARRCFFLGLYYVSLLILIRFIFG